MRSRYIYIVFSHHLSRDQIRSHKQTTRIEAASLRCTKTRFRKGWVTVDGDSNPREETTIRKRETQITTTTAQTVFYYYQSNHLFPCQ